MNLIYFPFSFLFTERLFHDSVHETIRASYFILLMKYLLVAYCIVQNVSLDWSS